MGSWIFIVFSLTQIIPLAQSKQTTCDFWWTENLDGLVADCSRKNLTSVPQDLPSDIVVLNLTGNIMGGNLTNRVFVLYQSLLILRLSHCRFERLERDAFLGLNNLSRLDLSFATYLDNGSYPQAIFDPLKNLETLELVGPIRDEFVFPCYIFLTLTKLTNLCIGTSVWPNLEECKDLKNMNKLKSLTFVATWPGALKNDTFIFLESLHIQNLTVMNILNLTEDCVFCPLKHITYLQIAKIAIFNNITLHDVTRFLYGLANRKYIINEINLAGVQDEQSAAVDVILDRQVIGYLPDICVKRLDLSGNRLMAIRNNTFQKSDIFTKCIEYLDFSRNYISFDIIFCRQMRFMVNLTLLDLSQNANRISPSSNICPTRCPQFEDSKKLNVGAESGYHISLPPKLEFLNLSNIVNGIFLGLDVNFSNGINLRVLDLSNNDILIGPPHVRVQGLSSISYLDISGMLIYEDTFTKCDLFTGVEILIARKSHVFPTSLMSKDSIFFRIMTNLTELDLSENSIQVINERTFSRLVNVVTFSLTGNQLSYIPEEVLSMPSLTSLDLSFNSINIIKKEERELLDKKLEQQGRFYLDIFGNIVSCTCSTLDFIKWLHETRITLGYKGNYSCLTDSGAINFTTQIYNDLMLHWRRCVGKFWLTVAVSVLLFIIICLLSAFLLKKYFPKVEHEILRWLGRVEPKRWDYEYDAYICYGDKDYQWPCHCLYRKLIERDETVKLYVPDLHDPFGEVKAEVIHAAIKRSWKLIIIVTDDLFTDEWSNFKVLEALRLFSKEGVITSRILLLYQDISPEAKARVPNVLLTVVPSKSILQVNPGDDFWAELHQMIISEDLDVNVLF